jgi:protein deglycase
MKKVLVLLAEGFEEVEALTPVDYLRRVGIQVTTAGIGGIEVTGSHGIKVRADTRLEDAGADFDCAILPGGMPGSRNLAESEATVGLVRRLDGEGKLVAAICAAPAVVLSAAAGILRDRRYSCYPGMETESRGGKLEKGRVVVDGNLITSRAAGTAGEFSLAIVEALLGKKTAEELAGKLLLER